MMALRTLAGRVRTSAAAVCLPPLELRLLPLARTPSSCFHTTGWQATNVNVQAVTGYMHLNNRNLRVFNEFSKQLKGEAKSNPGFQKSMKEFTEKVGVVKEDVKLSYKLTKIIARKTAETISKSVGDALAEAEATSKKATANVKERMSAATEEVKESFGLGKEETSSFRDGSHEASKHGKTEASSQSDDKF